MTTRRKYADELYPPAKDGETRPLSVEVPYLYACAHGLNIWGTGWFDAPWKTDQWAALAIAERTSLLVEARHEALLADALLQGMGGQEAWDWADERAWDETGEIVAERAVHYGVPLDRIKPYPCGPEPEYHDHKGEPAPGGGHYVNRVKGRESECPDCCEEVLAWPKIDAVEVLSGGCDE